MTPSAKHERTRYLTLCSVLGGLASGLSSCATEPAAPPPSKDSALVGSSEAMTSSSVTPAASPSSSNGAAPSATSVAPACDATRAFSSPSAHERVQLPPGFNATACQVLSLVFPDYDAATESAASAKGAVRASDGVAIDVGGTSLVALPYYVGASAEESFLCGCCDAKAEVVLADASAGQINIVGKTEKPIEHRGLGTGVEGWRGKLAFSDTEDLVTLVSTFACGTAPARRYLHGLRRQGAALREVLTWRVGARGVTAGVDVSQVAATVTSERGPGAANDVLFSWNRAPCPFDDKAGEYVCGAGAPAGSDRLRFDGKSFKLKGARAKLDHF